MIGWGAIGCLGFPGSSAGKESTSNTGDRSLIPGLGRSIWRRDRLPTLVFLGFPGGSDGEESACNAGDLGLIPGLGRSPEEGNSYPFQYPCLENFMDRGAWQATVHGVTESDMTEQLPLSRKEISSGSSYSAV